MAEGGGDGADVDQCEWLSDYVMQILKSPTWVSPIAEFVDEQCYIFDGEEENKLEYTTCHNQFRQLVDNLLAAHLLELSVTPEQFGSFCQRGLGGNPRLHRVLVEQLLSVEDFLTFKAMMSKRNADIYRVALMRVEAANVAGGAAAAAAPVVEADTAEVVAADEDDLSEGGILAAEWRLYEDQLFQAMVNSEGEANAQTDEYRCFEEELAEAIALSLNLNTPEALFASAEPVAGSGPPLPTPSPQLQEETAAMAPPPPAAATAAAGPPPQERAPLAPLRAMGGRAGRGVLPRVLRVERLPSAAAPSASAPSPAAAAPPPAADAEQREEQLRERRRNCQAILQRERGRMPEQSAVTQAELRSRAEHLQSQREQLLQKRKKERERQLGEFQRSHARSSVDGASTAAGEASQKISGQQLAAELGSRGATAAAAEPLPDAAVAARQMRQALTLQLRQTLSSRQ